MKKLLCVLSLLLVFGIENLSCMEARDNLEDYYPKDFFCPIGLNIIRDAVQTEVDITYDRENIEQWFTTRRAQGLPLIDPLTKQVLQSSTLKKNYALQSAIDHYRPVARQMRTNESMETVVRSTSRALDAFTGIVTAIEPHIGPFLDRLPHILERVLAPQERINGERQNPRPAPAVELPRIFPDTRLESHAKKSRTNYVIYFYNYSGEDLRRSASSLTCGEWCALDRVRKEPPEIIRRNERVVWASESNASGGPKGKVQYCIGKEYFSISWHNPIFGRNDYVIDSSKPGRIQSYPVANGCDAIVQLFFE